MLPGQPARHGDPGEGAPAKNAAPQFEVARQRAMAALDGHRLNEARAALDKMRSLDPEHPAVAELASRIDGEPQSAPPSSPHAEAGESTNPGFAAGRDPAERSSPAAGPRRSVARLAVARRVDSSAVAPPTDFRQPSFGGPLAGTRGEPAAAAAASHASEPVEHEARPARRRTSGAPPPASRSSDVFGRVGRRELGLLLAALRELLRPLGLLRGALRSSSSRRSRHEIESLLRQGRRRRARGQPPAGHRDLVADLPDRHQQLRRRRPDREGAPGDGGGQPAHCREPEARPRKVRGRRLHRGPGGVPRSRRGRRERRRPPAPTWTASRRSSPGPPSGLDPRQGCRRATSSRRSSRRPPRRPWHRRRRRRSRSPRRPVGAKAAPSTSAS